MKIRIRKRLWEAIDVKGGEMEFVYFFIRLIGYGNDNDPIFVHESYTITFREDLSDLPTDNETGMKIITTNISATDKDKTSFEFGQDSIT